MPSAIFLFMVASTPPLPRRGIRSPLVMSSPVSNTEIDHDPNLGGCLCKVANLEDNDQVFRSVLISLLLLALFLHGLTADATLATSAVVNHDVPQGMGST